MQMDTLLISKMDYAYTFTHPTHIRHISNWTFYNAQMTNPETKSQIGRLICSFKCLLFFQVDLHKLPGEQKYRQTLFC